MLLLWNGCVHSCKLPPALLLEPPRGPPDSEFVSVLEIKRIRFPCCDKSLRSNNSKHFFEVQRLEFMACQCCVSGSAAEPMAGGSRAVHFTGAREQREEGATVKMQSLDGVLVGFQGDLTGHSSAPPNSDSGFECISRLTWIRLEPPRSNGLQKFPRRHTRRCALLVFSVSQITAVFQTLSKVLRGVLVPQLARYPSPAMFTGPISF